MGGQSSARFQRIREEKRDAYVKISCEISNLNFITDNMPNIKGLFIAGNGDFKTKLSTSAFLD